MGGFGLGNKEDFFFFFFGLLLLVCEELGVETVEFDMGVLFARFRKRFSLSQ